MICFVLVHNPGQSVRKRQEVCMDHANAAAIVDPQGPIPNTAAA